MNTLYTYGKYKMVSISDCLSAISDDKSLVLFNTIALASGDTGLLLMKRKIKTHTKAVLFKNV